MIHHGKSPQQLDSYINTKFNRLRNMTRFTKYDQILLKNQQEQHRPFHNHKAAVYHKDMTIINVCPPNNREPNEAKTQLKKTAGNSGRITVELTVSLRMSDGTNYTDTQQRHEDWAVLPAVFIRVKGEKHTEKSNMFSRMKSLKSAIFTSTLRCIFPVTSLCEDLCTFVLNDFVLLLQLKCPLLKEVKECQNKRILQLRRSPVHCISQVLEEAVQCKQNIRFL